MSDVTQINITKEASALSQAGFGRPILVSEHTDGGKVVFTTTFATDSIDIVGHGYTQGDGPFQVISATTLPAGYTASTPYWLIVTDVDTLQLAISEANALAGTPAVAITDDGTGEHHLFDAARSAVFSGSAILTDMIAGGFALTSIPYLQANALLSQSPQVQSIAIGRKDAGDADYGVSMAAIEAEYADWYASVIASRVEAEINATAAWTESRKKIFIGHSNDSDDITVTGGVVANNKSLSRARSFLGYRNPTVEDYLDCGILGIGLTGNLDQVNGQKNWSNWRVVGTLADTITSAERDFVHGHNGYTYDTNDHSTPNLRNVVNGVGDPTNIMVAIDWLEQRMSEDVFSLIQGSDMVGMDQAGLDQIENAVNNRLETGVSNGVIVSYEVFNDGIQAVSAADKTTGTVRVIRFTAILRRGIDEIIIDGKVAV